MLERDWSAIYRRVKRADHHRHHLKTVKVYRLIEMVAEKYVV